MSSASHPSNRALRYVEAEGANGALPRTIDVTDYELKPLGFEELVRARRDKQLTIPLEIFNCRVARPDIGSSEISERVNIRTQLQSHFTAKAIGLVRGGWLPSALAAHRRRTVVLPDRNVVSEIVSRFEGGVPRGREPDFLDLFEDEPVRINPLLYAMEGNVKAIPCPQLVAEQLKEATEKLQKALPKAILQLGPDSLKGILGMIEDTRRGMGQRQEFLLRLAPNLKSPVGGDRLDRCWNEVLAAADACGVPQNSLVVLAALSIVAVPGGGSPAVGLLKFKEGYSAADAYNALADLRAIDLLIQLFGAFPGETIQLCTADRHLALFWTGIRAHNFNYHGSSASFDLAPVKQLLPGEATNRWRRGLPSPKLDEQ